MYQALSVLGRKIKASWSMIFNGEVNTELQNAIAEKVNSTDRKELYTFTFLFNKIREWLDNGIFETGKDYEYEISNKKWHEGFKVDEDYLDDIKATSPLSADLQLQLSTFNEDFVNHKDELINDILIANGTAFDGTAFFSNTRPNIPESTVLDNLYTGTGITLATIEADLNGARSQLRGYKIKSKPINKSPKFVVLAPSHLENQFNKLANSEIIIIGGVSTTNDLKGTFEVIINDEQDTSNNDWYLFNKKAPMKPVILQDRQAVKFKEFKDEEKDVVKFSFKARYNVGYGNPLGIIKIDN